MRGDPVVKGTPILAETSEKARLAAVARLLGAPSTFRKVPQSPLEAHEMILNGLPSRALLHLVQNLVFLRWDDSFAKAIGMSHRTYQRHVSVSAKQLSAEQSGRTWRLAEILAKATSILGSKEEAEQWLERPAIASANRLICWRHRLALNWFRIFSFDLSTVSTRDATIWLYFRADWWHEWTTAQAA
jgi:putative toxin-antitoxin system antitoxin component (TIGR02293 family)